MKKALFWWLPLGKVPEVSPQELRRWIDEKRNIVLVDARTSLEYDAGTIENALFAPLTDMPASMERLDFDPEKPVVVLCLSGHRSRPGTRWLRARGVEAYSLQGGISAWKRAGLPLNKPDHRPA